MKKITALILACICAMSAAGCAQNPDRGASQNPSESNISDNEPNKWGVSLYADNVTAVGLTIVCTQSGGENTAELNTGSYYVILKSEETGWVDVEYLPHEYQPVWTSEAWIIQKESTTKWDVNWESLYGKLPAGKYRIGKELMNYRSPGNFDKEMIYAEFAIN